jgi:hypothetical protein
MIRLDARGFTVRIVIFLTSTLLGATAGFFAGGYLFNYTHPMPTRTAPLSTLPYGSARQFQELQGIGREGGAAIQRHLDRHSWLHTGCMAGAALGFVGPIIVSRVGARSGRRPARIS